MKKEAKEYMEEVVDTMTEKYSLSQIEAYRAVRDSFLYDSLVKFPEETMHDDIMTNADFVYKDYISEQLLQM